MNVSFLTGSERAVARPENHVSAAACPIRVLHTPELVGGNAGQLVRAEREIGLHSRCISFWRHPFGYPCDEVLWDNPHTVVTNELKRLRLLWRALREFEVVHFNFGMPILPKQLDSTAQRSSRAQGWWRAGYNLYASLVEFRDLPLLRKAGKAIFVTYQGDDARQGTFCGSHFRISPVGEVDSSYYPPESDTRKQREIATFDRYSNGIFSLNPDLLHVLPPRARFLPYSHLDLRDWRPVTPNDTASRPLVIHAPSHRGIKGTRFVLDAVSRLQGEGVPFEFRLIEGMANAEARKIYEKADLLVDQLLTGWYGGLSVELMALGKPVVCYLREQDLRFLEPAMRSQLPIIGAEPGTIYRVLKEQLTARRRYLPEIGALSRAYVERWHDPLRTARFLKEEYVSALHQIRGSRDAAVPRTVSLPPVSTAQSGSKHILVISLSDLARDPRVSRQIKALADRFRVTAAGFTDPGVPGVEFVEIPRVPRSPVGKAVAAAMLKLGLFERFYWSSRSISHVLHALESATFDLILANDVNTLPLACRLQSRRGVIFDAHEYSPREYEDSFFWRFFFQGYNEYLCRTYAGHATGMLTVCQSIADEYKVNYGVDPKVLTNAPRYRDLQPRRTNAGRIRMVHHGGATPSRRIELMIDMMALVEERFQLDLMLMSNNETYYQRLVAYAATQRRVRVVPPVPMEELPSRLNEYDIGVYLLPPNSLNNRYALPNKFFEFIQGRLAIAIGPSPEMAQLVRQYDCGVIADDFTPQALAARLNALDARRIDHYKQQSHRAAQDLCFEKNSEMLLNMIATMAGSA